MTRKARTPEGQALLDAMRERREARSVEQARKAEVRATRVAGYRAMMEDAASRRAKRSPKS